MITAHLTDAEIQLYIAEPETISDQLKVHVQDCAHCRVNIANYQVLFNAIKDQAKPQFDFDLTSLVLEQLPQSKRLFPWATLLIAVFSVSLIALFAIFFQSYIAVLVTGASMVLITTAITAAAVILIFQTVEMVKNHQKQIHALLKAKSLQL